MMLASEQMRVALVTTHLPLRAVADAITSSLIIKVIAQLNNSLINQFGIKKSKDKSCRSKPTCRRVRLSGDGRNRGNYPCFRRFEKTGN